jgi:membrane protease YdiL (CAAX protease family)
MSALPDHDLTDPPKTISPDEAFAEWERTDLPIQPDESAAPPHDSSAEPEQPPAEKPQPVDSFPEEPVSESPSAELSSADSSSEAASPAPEPNPPAVTDRLEQLHASPAPNPEDSPAVFQPWTEPEPPPASRIPNLGHLAILAFLAVLGWMGAGLLGLAALHFHLFGISTLENALTDIHYTLGSMIAVYLITFGAALFVFPLVWDKSFFAGIHWNGATALLKRWRLFSAAFACFVCALLNGWLMPGPDNTPIDKIFRAPGAAWLLFVFGITAAPFFEEIIFRGFLLPALCTAFDWTVEKLIRSPAPPLDANGNPQWSIISMVVSSILTSVPFALMHAEQTGYSLGPFVLLISVSMVLCWARLSTRSLAASVFVHASYNCLLFSLMLVGTGGFQHLDKM